MAVRHCRSIGRLVPAVMALALAGCTGATRVYNVEVTPSYTLAEFGYGAGRRDLRTTVRGDPFAMGEERFAAAVVDALQNHQPRPQPTHYTLAPGPDARPAYRAVFVFDGPPATGRAICMDPPALPRVASEPDRVRVLAAFCRHAGVLTRVTGAVDGAQGVDDPRFQALLNQLVAQLFPLVDPQQRDDDPIWLP